ncbi:unnamed protein product [Camellia sinensis]
MINVVTQRGFVLVDERILPVHKGFMVFVEQVSGKDHLLNHLGILAACFTHPEISMVGLTESVYDGDRYVLGVIPKTLMPREDKFGVRPLGEKRPEQMMAALYLQVSIVSQALIFVTRSRSWSFAERPGLLLLFAFVAAQLIATLIVVYAKWGFGKIEGCGWGWAGVIWLYSVTAFTTKSNYGKEEREAQWATAQRTLHGLQLPETTNLFSDKSNYRELSEIAEQAKRRAEVASYTYSGEASEEFDRDDNTLTLIKPSPMPSKDIRSPLEVGSVHGGNNGVWNVDLEENKIE